MNDTAGRNRYTLTIEIEMTHPIGGNAAKSAADLAARDILAWFNEIDWGYGAARVESVYAPASQFEHGDFDPGEVAAVAEP